MKTKTIHTRKISKKLPVQPLKDSPPLNNLAVNGQEVIDSQELLDALYWVWDALERSSIPFFLVYQTYEDAKANRDLTGDKVEIGVRRNEWVSGGRRIMDAFITPATETDDEVIYHYKKVNSSNISILVIVHIYDDSPCITSLDMIHYRYEEFYVPNPYKTFIEVYG